MNTFDVQPGSDRNRSRRPSDPWAMALLSAAVAVVVWGAVVFAGSPAASYPQERRGHYCDEAGHLGETVAGLWVPYAVLLGIGVAAMLLYAANTASRLRLGLALGMLVTVIVTFPWWAAMGVTMDCGL